MGNRFNKVSYHHLENHVLLRMLKHLKSNPLKAVNNNKADVNRILKSQYLALIESYLDKRVLNEIISIISKSKPKVEKLFKKF